MLRLELFKNEIKIFIRKKTGGKIRFKRFNQYGLGEQIKQEDINLKENNQYIEWLITYNIEASKNDFDPNWLISECTYKDIKGKKKTSLRIIKNSF